MSGGPASTVAGMFLLTFGIAMLLLSGTCAWAYLSSGGSVTASVITLIGLVISWKAIAKGLDMTG